MRFLSVVLHVERDTKGETIMAMLTGEWLDAMQEEFQKPYYKELYQFVKEEYDSTQIFPPADDIFNAMHFTPLNKVRQSCRLLCKIFIRNCRKILAVLYQTMDI